MVTGIDHFTRLRQRPHVVLWRVRTALRNAIAKRRAGGARPTRAAFAIAARAVLARSGSFREATPCERQTLTASVDAAAECLFTSKLMNRLLLLPLHQFENADSSEMADAIVRDGKGGIHIIALSMHAERLPAQVAAANLAGTLADQRGPCQPATVHLFSLVTGSRYVSTVRTRSHGLLEAS